MVLVMKLSALEVRIMKSESSKFRFQLMYKCICEVGKYYENLVNNSNKKKERK